jgi:hypothetical protein
LEKALRYTIEAARQMYHSPLNAWDAVAQFNRAKELMRRMPEVDQTLKKKISKESYQAFRFARELDYWTYYGHKLDACMTEDEYELHGGLGDTLHY